MKQLFSLLFLFVFVSGLALAQDTPTLIGNGHPQWNPADLDVLYEQMANAGTNSNVSQNFEASFDVYDCQGADDFEVPTGETWSIESIDVLGVYFNGTGPATSFNVYFYNDAAGLPGTEVASALNAAYTDPGGTGSVSVAFSPAIVLTAGSYWVSVQANLDFGVGGEWGWTEQLQTNLESAFQNPGGGFGVCPAWAYRVTTCAIGTAPYYDNSFRLNGTIGGGAAFYDDFDSYTAGQQLACQNPTDWTTWSNLPCDPTEDAYISSNYSYSGANSCVIVQNNDLVKLHGSQTTGQWYTSFLLYIPAGKAGYFNQLSGFAPNPNQWAVEVYFDAGGVGRVVADVTTNFTWQEDTWQQVVLLVDLDTHQATIWFGGSDPLTQIYTWDWTRGGTINNQIDANDFFGATANDEMYMDNYYFDNAMPPIISGSNGILLISENTTGADSVEAWLNALGEMYTRVTNTVALTMPTSQWLTYDAVYYIGTTSAGAESDSCKAYLDGGGNLLVADNDEGYYINSTPLYNDYLMSIYVSDGGSDGTITGMDIMAGLTLDISADPYPDDILPNTGAYGTGVPIFLAPTGNTYAGMRGPGGFFRSEYLCWDPQYTGGSYADILALYSKTYDWLAFGIIPVELTSFTATANQNKVELNWTTATETNNQGFDIERNSGNGFEKVGYIPGFGTTTEEHSYSFTDVGMSSGNYSYRLKQIDFNGTFEYSKTIEVEVVVPDVYSLAQNYPNPFNPSTKITFSLAADSKVSLKVFDVLGQEVASLINQELTAGVHNVDFNAARFNSGVYFYRIEATGVNNAKFVDVKKMILMK
jgi:hypothetical protein